MGAKGDTLNRVDANGKKQGPWVIKVPDLRGERGYEEEGVFKNDVKEGVWRRYSVQGDLIGMESYKFGYKHGKAAYFNYQGELEREESWRAIDPQNPYDTVPVFDVNDPTKIVRFEIVKVEPNSYKHGTWRFYDPRTGRIEDTEEWVMNKPKEKEIAVVAADDMAPIDPAKAEADEEKKKVAKEKAKPKEVLEFEKKNSGKKKIKYRTGSTGG